MSKCLHKAAQEGDAKAALAILQHSHGWGLPEGVEPPIIHNPFLGWLLLPLAPSAIPMRIGTQLEYISLWVMWAF
jgi:hypothetical protein